jgi:hypothetical protein
VTIDNGETAEKRSTQRHYRAQPLFTCCYLLASAEFGKTQRLVNVLSRSYGFYFISGAIEEKATKIDSGEALY